jgi:hypothetical protein
MKMKKLENPFIIPTGLTPTSDVINKVKDFLNKFKALEVENGTPILIIELLGGS